MFKNSGVVETKLLQLQPFINSHFHFLIVMESVTQTNYGMTRQCQDQGIFFPKFPVLKLPQLLSDLRCVRSCWGTEPRKQPSLFLWIASCSCHNKLLHWLFCLSPYVTQITFFFILECKIDTITIPGQWALWILWLLGSWVLPLHSRSFWGLRWWICVSLSLWIPGTWFYSPLIHCTLKRVIPKHLICVTCRMMQKCI